MDSDDKSSIFLKKQSAIFSNFIEDNLYLDNKLKYYYIITVENNNHATYLANFQFKTYQLKFYNIYKVILLVSKQIELHNL